MVATSPVLTRDALRSLTPSVFASQPWEKMSSRYRHVPTIEVVDILRDRGFHPVKAAQSRTRIEGKQAFTRHALRFRHEDYLRPDGIGEEVPEIIVTNSHDGSSAYQFHLGLTRLVCQNGLCIASADFGGISVRHSGGSDFTDRVLDASFRIVEDTPKTLETVEQWKRIALPAPLQTVFAEAAHVLIDNPNVKPEQLLTPRRREDRPDGNGDRSLWQVYNNVQEVIMKGGVTNTTPSGRRSTTRAIKSVSRDISLNRALWVLADKLAQHVS